MTINPVRMYGPAQLPNSATTLYTCPASTIAVCKYIRVYNPTGGAVNFTLSIGANSSATQLFSAVSIPAGGSLSNPFVYWVLAAGEIFQALASAANSLVVTLNGTEQT